MTHDISFDQYDPDPIALALRLAVQSAAQAKQTLLWLPVALIHFMPSFPTGWCFGTRVCPKTVVESAFVQCPASICCGRGWTRLETASSQSSHPALV